MTSSSIPESDPSLPHLASDFIEQNFPEELDNFVPTRGYQLTPMVRIGGSAGSFQALSEINTVEETPPGKHLATFDGHLQLTDLENEPGRRVAVDFFFCSLTDTHGAHAAARAIVVGDALSPGRRLRRRCS